MKAKLLVILLGIFLIALTMRSILGPTFFRPHDSTHAARLVEMQRSLMSGEFPVRWSRNFGFGYGMPLFNFYAPLPYYLGQIPLFLRFSPIDSIKWLYLLNGVLAFTGMYLFAAKLWGKWGGVISATIFSLSSYRAVDLFVRGAVGEAFAMVLLPFVLLGVHYCVERKRVGLPLLAVSLAAVLLSHNLTGMVSVGIVVFYWLVLSCYRASGRIKLNLSFLLLPLLLALGIAGFYIIPAFMEKGLTRVDQTITVGYFDYHNHFLCFSQLFSGTWKYGASLPGCTDDVSFSLGMAVWAIGVMSVFALWRWGSRQDRLVGLSLLLLFGVSAFLTIGRSSIIWDHISLLKYFQFPWRFLAFAHVFIAALCGAVVLMARKIKLTIVVTGILMAIMVITHAKYYLPEKQQLPKDLMEFYDSSPEWIRSEISKTLNDYLPPRVRGDAFPSPSKNRFEIDKGSLSIVQDDSTLAVAKVSCHGQCLLTINNFQFPGWVATVNGKVAALRAVDVGLPIYTLSLSKGEYLVGFQFVGTDLEKLANLLTIISLILLALITLKQWGRSRARRTRSSPI